MKDEFKKILDSIRAIVDSDKSRSEKLEAICRLLYDSIPHYDWVGFYLADSEHQQLILGPFIGEPTEHVKISFGSGICGQAAEKLCTFVVPDVTAESNYLACSPKVKSEIVVPVMKEGKIVAELDIDSYTLDAFKSDDKELLEQICRWVAELF